MSADPGRSQTSWIAWVVLLLLLVGGAALNRLSDLTIPGLAIEAAVGTSTPTLLARLVPTPSRLPQGMPASAPTSIPKGTSTELPVSPIPTWRAGLCVSQPASIPLWAGRLGASWYLDWQADDPVDEPSGEPSREPLGSHPEYWRMVRTTQKGIQPPLSRIRELAQGAPGGVWIVGNEPDVIWQDNLSPEDYAVAYGQVYDTIKAADPAARIAVGGISQGTPLRLQYLDRVLAAYQKRYHQPLPADWWTVHGYVLREERASWGVEIPPGIQAQQGKLYEIDDHGRLDIFERQLRDFRTWMAHNGYQQVPLALTEFGILMPVEYGFPPEFVAAYLRDSFHLLETMRDEDTGYPPDDFRLVQRWAWYSLSDPTFATSDLADLENDRLTLVGQAYREYISEMTTP